MLNFKTLCLIQAPIETVSGYGQHSRDIVKSLMKIYPDWEYSIIATRWGDTPQNGLHDENIKSKINRTGDLPRKPDIFIQISVPNEFNPIGEYNIGITAGIETNIASAEFLVGANKMQLLIVPSQHVKTVFETSQWQNKDTKEVIKLTTKCEVLFEGVDLNVYQEIKWID